MMNMPILAPVTAYGRRGGRMNVVPRSAPMPLDVRTGDAKSNRDKIHRFEDELLRLTSVHVSLEVRHYFSKGLYAREIFIPKGVVLTGKIHKYESLNIVSAGRISVFTEDGMKVIEAPHTVVSRPGTKRVGYALEDTVWTTIHATNETDLEKLEAELIAKTYDDVALIGEVVARLEGN